MIGRYSTSLNLLIDIDFIKIYTDTWKNTEKISALEYYTILEKYKLIIESLNIFRLNISQHPLIIWEEFRIMI